MQDPNSPAPDGAAAGPWRWLRTAARVLIVSGALILGFVVYQLWGTGWQQAQAQRDLRDQFEQQLTSTTVPPTSTTSVLVTTLPPVAQPTSPVAQAPSTARATTHSPTPVMATVVQDTEVPTTSTSTTTTTTTTTTTLPPPPPRPELVIGEPVARLEIPSIGLDQIVVEGVGEGQLAKGPGHYSATPLPGEFGNAAIAGHRTTHGAPFFDLDKLVPGDEIDVTTYAGRFVYRVTGSIVVSPRDVGVVANSDGYHLTLTTCTPKYSARKRLVISADLDPAASSPPLAPPTVPQGFAKPVPGATPLATSETGIRTLSTPVTAEPSAAPASTVDEPFRSGWFRDPGAWPHLLAWGLLLIVVAFAASRLGRATGHRWVGWLVGCVPFLFALFFFYANLSRVVPPNL
jgi:sortase A